MIGLKNKLMFILISSLILLVSCRSVQVIHEPDTDMFNKVVGSTDLQDSLKNGILTIGMPHFVVSQLFRDTTSTRVKIPVASIGSKQRLVQSEGLGRDYVDSNVKVFLDEYMTEKGELKVWYQVPNFYGMNVSSGDTLCIYYEETEMCSRIECLKESIRLTIRDSLSSLPENTNLYAEIKYKENDLRDVSYWFTLHRMSKPNTFKLRNINYNIYPIEWLELDDEPINSFKWR